MGGEGGTVDLERWDRKKRWGVVLGALGAFLGPSSLVASTDHAASATLQPLCHWGDTVLFFVHAQGPYVGWPPPPTWSLGRLDARTGKWKIRSIGESKAVTTMRDEMVAREASCLPRALASTSWVARSAAYLVIKGTLVVDVYGKRRKVAVVRSFRNTVHETKAVPGVFNNAAVYPYDEIKLRTRTVLLLPVEWSANGEVTTFYYSLRTDVLARAKARAFNAAGLEFHGRGAYEQSGALFEEALSQDRNHPKAAYNLACSWARRKNATKAVEILQQIPGADLQKRVSRDRDFDAIRNHPDYRRFIKSRP